ncbi:MAG: hypothetical protein LBH90_09510 [Tannerella sp.]|nr:hypothetical protein [Tannerella sp.]
MTVAVTAHNLRKTGIIEQCEGNDLKIAGSKAVWRAFSSLKTEKRNRIKKIAVNFPNPVFFESASQKSSVIFAGRDSEMHLQAKEAF